MRERPGIFIGIPKTKDYQPFLDSLSVFLPSLSEKYDVEMCEVKDKLRDVARNEIVEKFLGSGKDYLLFLDDDHSGHTVEMVDDLINSNAEFCSIKCYARYYPYQLTICSADKEYQDQTNLERICAKKGYSPCHFAGFGMAIIKRELFDKISKPYFECNEIGEREDNYFCKKLIDAGVQPIGCFNHTLDHNGVNDDTVLNLRKAGLKNFVFKQHQRLRLKNIMDNIKESPLPLPRVQQGQIMVMDLMLNKEVILMPEVKNA